MLIRHKKQLKDGRRLVTVELASCEHLIAVADGEFYRLGGQLDDIVAGHVIEELKQVRWCSIEQKWTED